MRYNDIITIDPDKRSGKPCIRGLRITVYDLSLIHIFAYNAQGYLQTVTDPLGRTVNYAYDAAGRVTTQTLPDGREILYGYDAGGNLTSLTPPGRSAHVFAYTCLLYTSRCV